MNENEKIRKKRQKKDGNKNICGEKGSQKQKRGKKHQEKKKQRKGNGGQKRDRKRTSVLFFSRM